MCIIARSTTSKYLNLVSIFLTFVKLKQNFSSQFNFLMIWHNMAEVFHKKPPEFTVVLPQMYIEKNMHHDMINYFFDWGKMHISLWYIVLKLFQEPPLTCPRRAFSHKRLQSWVICGHWAVCSMKCLLVSGSSSMLSTIHLESKVYINKHGL